MALNWFPIRENLCSVREVIAISAATKMSVYEVVGRLVGFWDWAQRETADGNLVDLNVDALVDAGVAQKSFLLALIRNKWLRLIPDPETPQEHFSWSGLQIPNFNTWLSEGAKARLQKNKRQKNWRGKSKDGRKNVDALVDAPASTDASTTEQNRTEQNIDKENNPPNPPKGGFGDNKAEKRKLESEKEKRIHNPDNYKLPSILETPQAAQAFRDWLEYKLTLPKHKRYTSEKGPRTLLTRWCKFGPAAFADAVQKSISENYQGLIEPRFKPAFALTQKPSTLDLNKKRLQEIAERERAAKAG